MHPGFLHWWGHRHGHGHGCGGEARAGCGPGSGGDEGRGGPRGFAYWAQASDDEALAGAGFGVRRPLRFLAYKLELSEAQVAQLARVLDELKIERAQAAVDHRRTSAQLADAVSGESLDAAALAAAAGERAKSAERVAQAVTRALGKIHQLLEPRQREQLAYLIRTGTLTL